MTWTNTLSYDWNIKDHEFNALLGMESYRYEGSYLGASQGHLKEGFDNWDHAWISNGTAASTADGLTASGYPHDEARSVSYFGRLGWNWQEKYMINATVRCDGSSRFASGHRFGWFPSVSAFIGISQMRAFMESAAIGSISSNYVSAGVVSAIRTSKTISICRLSRISMPIISLGNTSVLTVYITENITKHGQTTGEHIPHASAIST